MNFQQITGENEKKSKNLVNISRNLSKILRHTALDLGLKMDDEGYVKLDDLVIIKRIFLIKQI